MKYCLFVITLSLFWISSPCAPPSSQRSPPIRTLPPSPGIKKTLAPLIVIDPGHGGMDKGASSGGVEEKSPTLETALLIKKYLIQKGYRVLLTRTSDTFISLDQRAAIANNCHCKLFVSIHYNAAKSAEAKGIEVYHFDSKDATRSKSSKKLATCLLHRLIANTGAKSRGVKAGNFHVIRETTMPAVLIEGGFITNSGERSLIRDEKYLDRIARSVAEGIDRYFQ